MPERHQGGENQSTQREAKEMKMEKAQIEKKKISVFTLSAPQSPFAAALQNAASKSFGYEMDKQLYHLLKEIRSKCEEYIALRQRIFKTQGTQRGNQTFLQGQGLENLKALNNDLGAQEVVLENAPIEIEAFPDGVPARDMILLEDGGIFAITEPNIT